MRGYAFVEFDEREDAMAAIDNYDQTDFMERTIRVRKSKPVDLKPNYHEAVWRNDDWLQKIERIKLENEKHTLEEQAKARALGLPIFKNLEKKDDKPLVFIEEDDWCVSSSIEINEIITLEMNLRLRRSRTC